MIEGYRAFEDPLNSKPLTTSGHLYTLSGISYKNVDIKREKSYLV